jgi:hypothetical protein
MSRLTKAIALASLAASGWSCVEVVTLDERPCPCSPGYACCAALGLCLTPDKVATLACAGPAGDGARPDAAGADLALPFDGPAGETRPADAPPADLRLDGDPGAGPDAAAADLPAAAVPPPDAASSDGDAPLVWGLSPCDNGGGGLYATYYDNPDFTARKLSRVEPVPALDWGQGSPDPSVGVDGWSATFTGQIEPTASELYTFALDADDGARLWVGGELVIDWWRRPFYLPMTGSLRLEAGRRYDVLVEYVEDSADARLGLRWQSPTTRQAVIAQCNLVPAVGQPSACPAGPGDCIPPGAAACPSADAGAGATRGLLFTRFREVFRTRFEDPTVVPGVSLYIDGDQPELPRSLLWEGFIDVPTSGSYSFFVTTVGTAKVYLSGDKANPVVQARSDFMDEWLREEEGTRFLPAGRHKIEVEHVFGTAFPTKYKSNPVLIHLRWRPPGAAKSMIPSCFFTPAEPP